MNMRKNIAVLLATCVFAVVAEDAPSIESALALKPQEHYSSIARKVANMLPAYHVTQRPLDEEISQRAWTNLVTMYDYNHAVFLQSDLDRFGSMQTRIGSALRKGDISFVYDVHKTFVLRLAECVGFVTNYLEKGEIDFSVNESYMYNRKDAPWPKTAEERDDIWRCRIKNEMLAQILSRELDDEEDAEAEKNGKKKKNRAKDKKKSAQEKSSGTNAVENASKPEPTPKETLLNKYRHYLAWVLTELDENKVMERYLMSTAMAYDPHSSYMAPDSKEDFDMDMSLSLCGVGAVLSQSMDDGSLEIKEVMKGGPMAREGSIKEGDKIVGVGQGDNPVEDIVWKPMRKSIKKIRGKKNTKVVLEVTDKNGASRRKVPIIRDEIKLEDQAATGRVETVTLDGVSRKMGYVKLPAFYGTMDKKPNDPGYRSCSLDVAKWVAKFNTQGVEGLILDLRGNGGGSLKEAVLLSALFVRPNPGPCPVVQIRETRNLYVLPTVPADICLPQAADRSHRPPLGKCIGNRRVRASGHRSGTCSRRHPVAWEGHGPDRDADGTRGIWIDEDHHGSVLSHQRVLHTGQGRRERHPPAVRLRRPHGHWRGQVAQRIAVEPNRTSQLRHDLEHAGLRSSSEGTVRGPHRQEFGMEAPVPGDRPLPRPLRTPHGPAGACGPQEDDERGARDPRRGRRGRAG